MHPSLQMARTGLDHYTGLMPLGRHGCEDSGRGAVQVDQDVTGVMVLGIRLHIDVAALAIARAQKPDGRQMQQLLGGPQPFPRKRPVGGLVNQTNEVQLVGHRRELAADGLRRENESMIEHKILPKGVTHRRRAMGRQGVRIQ